ncbi:hypothetical protein AVEN_97114-1 [Araneus ventricosus]|uniref:Uncharacterized protein n=1 Tax=Araneus ventricosus TaxID=182803 RepID=A0A4Y2SW07_ARAVE|nr:hypothetical protein AVEN_97114-1 [Araneus ventricosus]
MGNPINSNCSALSLRANNLYISDPWRRYEVSLPWMRAHPQLPSCWNLAKKQRLCKCVKDLQLRNKVEVYEAAVEHCLGENVIEKAVLVGESGIEHFYHIWLFLKIQKRLLDPFLMDPHRKRVLY